MNIGQTTYVRYEKGDRNPTYATIIVMAQVLNVSPEYLIGKEDSPEMFKIMELSEKLDSKGRKKLLKYAEELTKL